TNIPISTNFSFEPALEYSQKGALWTSGGTDVKSKISYLDIPLMAKFNLSQGFGIFLGPQVSFFLDQETEIESGSGSTTVSGDNDDFAKSLAGGKVGASYNFGSVALNASYATDFQNLNKDNGGSDLKNQTFNIGLAFRLR